jgi:hypothetical protein
MGNAGRNGGEYYTPRALIRAMMQVMHPQIGERIYDGACGSAGFLCETHDYLSAKPSLTTADLQTLQTRTFYGKEKKKLLLENCNLHTVLDCPGRNMGKTPAQRCGPGRVCGTAKHFFRLRQELERRRGECGCHHL